MFVNLIMWRCMTAQTLDLEESWEGETHHSLVSVSRRCWILIYSSFTDPALLFKLFKFCMLKVNKSPHVTVYLVCLRFCGSTIPPDLTSSGPHMTVVFVADEGVADSGFNATYRAVSVLDSEFSSFVQKFI